MKHFRFRLQAVLEQRERRETLAKQTYAEAQAALSRAERLLLEMQEVRQAILDELCRRHQETRQGAFDVSETQTYQEYLQVITQSLREQAGDVQALTSSCAAHKLHLIGASQDKQALTTLHDRHKLAHAKAAQRVEQAVMDELATSRFNFGQRAGEG